MAAARRDAVSASQTPASSHLWSLCARASLVLALVMALAGSVAGTEPIERIPNPRARDGTWVTDLAGGLRADTVAKLNAMLGDLQGTTGAEMAVVVVTSLDGQSVEEYAARLFQLWGIGKAAQDNGLLLLWSTGDRRVRLEVGYGLEGTLPDGRAGAILDTYIIPRFKAGQFDEGVLAGVDAIVRALGNQPVPLVSPKSQTYDSAPDRGGVSGFGLGSFLLGLAGATTVGVGSLVGLRRWRRYRRRRCPQCRARMRRLDEAEDDANLEEGQRAEEKLGSVDYDVWACPSCSHRVTLRYPKWLTGYGQCPQCLNHTKSSTETVVERATVHGSGSARVVDKCAFCNYHTEYTKVLPRLERSTSSSGGSSGGGSSFGGGSSGGGGASRGY
jgi:uncharacterized protein